MNLNDPIENLPYVGKTYARRLQRLNIATIRDLLYHFPFRYQDFSEVRHIREIQIGEEVAVRGQVVQVTSVRSRRGKFLTKAAIADRTGAIEAVWFNQPYLSRTLKKGTALGIAGKVTDFGGKISFVSPEIEVLGETRTQTHTAGLVPIYPETAQVSSRWLRNRIRGILEGEGEISEFIPTEILARRDLPNRDQAIRMFHFPKVAGEVTSARRRMAFEELFLFNLRSLQQRRDWKSRKASLKLEAQEHREELDQFVRSFPFSFTAAQQRAVQEILTDLAGETPMNRLLEGDVGSGKTAVAAVAAYLTFLSGARTVFMAPTEILADQHFQTLRELLEPRGVKIALHTGSRKEKVGDHFDLWIGTHALFYRQGNFENVGLVVIDEQHRFGVEQRAEILQKARTTVTPHLLTLTATPIPRTLALTVYGDLDLSVLDELPPGRKRVKTFVVPSQKREAGYQWIRQKTKAGEQAFVICPLIEESEAESLQQVKAATAEFETLRRLMPDVKIDLLHGKLGAKEKTEIMDRFKRGETQILVSTPVVEVGIDVPNATMMVIQAAERFGLASLHQLRGRVGRNTQDAYCFLFTEDNSAETLRRLRSMEKFANGFELAELDLKRRGPGEIYGIKQHGLTELRVADLTDAPMLKMSRDDAQEVLTRDPDLSLNPSLAKELRRFSTARVEPN